MPTDSYQNEVQNDANIAGSNVGVALLCLFCMGIGWLSSYMWLNRGEIADLWLQASQQKYQTMTGEIGPVTYLVQHNGYNELESFLSSHDDVLGIEVYELPDKAAIAFKRADSTAIDAVKQSPYVLAMRQQVIPMMCH